MMPSVSTSQSLQELFADCQQTSEEHPCLIAWQQKYYLGIYQVLSYINASFEHPIYSLKIIAITHAEYLDMMPEYPTICISDRIRLLTADQTHIVTLIDTKFCPLSEKDSQALTMYLQYSSRIKLELSYQV